MNKEKRKDKKYAYALLVCAVVFLVSIHFANAMNPTLFLVLLLSCLVYICIFISYLWKKKNEIIDKTSMTLAEEYKQRSSIENTKSALNHVFFTMLFLFALALLTVWLNNRIATRSSVQSEQNIYHISENNFENRRVFVYQIPNEGSGSFTFRLYRHLRNNNSTLATGDFRREFVPKLRNREFRLNIYEYLKRNNSEFSLTFEEFSVKLGY